MQKNIFDQPANNEKHDRLTIFCDSLVKFLNSEQVRLIFLSQIQKYEESEDFTNHIPATVTLEGFMCQGIETESLLQEEELRKYLQEDGCSLEITLNSSKSPLKPSETFFVITIPGVGVFDTQWKPGTTPKETLQNGRLCLEADLEK
jgi:hypothetical protein